MQPLADHKGACRLGTSMGDALATPQPDGGFRKPDAEWPWIATQCKISLGLEWGHSTTSY